MLKRLSSALITVALLIAADPAISLGCKPPDLPLQTRETIEPLGAPGSTRPEVGAIRLQRANRTNDAPQMQESTSLLFDVLSRFVEALQNGISNPPTAETVPVPSTVPIPSPAGDSDQESRAQQARLEMSAARLYTIGVRCEADGDYAMARNCFEEVTRVCPNCKYGTMASEKLAAIKTSMRRAEKMLARSNLFSDGVEEQDAPLAAAQRDLIVESRQSLRHIQQAQRSFQIGERYETSGHIEKAYNCYQEAHMICPSSRYGRQALERLHLLQAQKMQRQEGGAEEQQQPPMVPRRHRLTQASEQLRQEGRTAFLLGERCNRGGDRRMAGRFYEESANACPGSSYSVRAQDRLQLLQARQRFLAQQDGTEESEPRAMPETVGGTQARRWAAYWHQQLWNFYSRD
jgi:tetratricopeptide (TPR) repeat protein